MTYPEFKHASKKHLLSCECLVFLLKSSCEKKEEYILSTIYYLSGYILETILKFTIYSAIGFNKSENIKSLNSNGLTYKDNIMIHNLNKLKREVEKRHISSLIKFDINKKLFNSWTSEFRYEAKLKHTKSEVLDFYEFAESNFRMLQEYK